MGCAESREKYDKADIANATPEAFSAMTPGTKPLAKATTYKLQARIFRLREDFDIKDTDGNVLCKILGKYVSLRDQQVLADASGKKMLCLHRKVRRLVLNSSLCT